MKTEERRLQMGESNEKKADNCKELQQMKDLYTKIQRVTEKGKDAIVKKKKDGRLYVYEGNLRLAE